MEPVKPKERLAEIDVLRGFAVLGMVLWDFRSHSMGNYVVVGPLDHLVNQIIGVINIQHTVHLIFAFLFGWGLAMPMRKDVKGAPFFVTNLRKLAALFVIGSLNCIFADRTDFILMYAMIGVLFLLFANLSNRTVLISAVLLVSVPVFGPILLSKFMSPHSYLEGWAYASLNTQIVMTSSYLALSSMRAHELVAQLAHPLTYIVDLDVLVMFLFGLYAVRRDIFRDIAGNKGFLRKVLWGGLAVHVLGLAASFFLSQFETAGKSGAHWLLLTPQTWDELVTAYSFQGFALFYVCAIALLMQHNAWKRVLHPLAPVGRLALSNYLLHSIAGPTLFFAYGFGFLGKFGMAFGEMVAIAFFALQIVLSSWWLKRFEFGPAEWLWRCAIYWEFLRFRRPQEKIRVAVA